MQLYLLFGVHEDHKTQYSSHLFSVYGDKILFETRLTSKFKLNLVIKNDIIYTIFDLPKERQPKGPVFFHLGYCYIFKEITIKSQYSGYLVRLDVEYFINRILPMYVYHLGDTIKCISEFLYKLTLLNYDMNTLAIPNRPRLTCVFSINKANSNSLLL